MIVPPHLVAHLDHCTVQVHGEHGFAGSGVFVAPGVVLTCAHVVIAARPACRIIWRQQWLAIDGEPELFPPPGPGVDDPYPYPDLAVLRLVDPPSHPCARLAEADPAIGARVYASGFSTRTLTDGPAPDGLLVEVAAPSGEFLRVKHDQIHGGLSGSPVLDPACDRVCGLVKATRDGNDERGGWIVPATAFSRYLQPVLQASQAYHQAGPPWDQLPLPQAWPTALRALFLAEREAAEKMPYRLTGAPSVNLAHIYVRQQVGERPKAAQQDRDADPRAAAATTQAEDVPDIEMVRDLGAALASHRDLLVVGGPGAGKSTLTLQLSGDLGQAWLDGNAQGRQAGGDPGFQLPRPLVPLRVTARSVAARRNLGWLGALAAAATAELQLATDLTAETLSVPVAGASWLVIIDALDEIVDLNAYRDLLGMLTACLRDQGQAFPHRLLITSRALADDDVKRLNAAGSTTYSLVPFDEPALCLFARRWFSRDGRTDGASQAERFLTQVREAKLAEVVTIPLLATVAAIVAEQHPDQPLPTHRYQLYQRYLDYLLYGRNQASYEPWPQLERQLSALPNGETLAGTLRSGRLELAEHLAVSWVESGNRLADLAGAWLKHKASAAGTPVDLELLPWLETGLTVAMASGLFVREGDDIFFLHQSFAEHLAARVHAERLPRPFDPDHADWRSWIDRAAADGLPSLTQTALTHYTHVHRGEELIGWLQDQIPSYQLLAGELIAYGAASAPDAVPRFCAAFGEWSISPDSSLFEGIFSRSAAALADLLDHACATSALAQVAQDDLVSWPRRIIAAEILAMAGPPHADHGLSVLREALAGQHTAANDRVRAATSLAVLDPRYRGQAAVAPRDVITSRRALGSAQKQTADSLARLDSRYRDQVAAALRDLITSSRSSGASLRQAALWLAGLGPEYGDQAAAALREVVSDRYRTTSIDRRHAAQWIMELGPQYRDQAAAAMRDIISSPAISYDRQEAAQWLFALGPRYRDQAAAAMRDVITSPRTGSYDRQAAARWLTERGSAYRDLAIAALQEVIADDREGAYERQGAAQSLARLDPRYRDQAIGMLQQIIADPSAGLARRGQAAQSLAELDDQYRDLAAAALREVIASHRTGPAGRLEAAQSLARLDPRYCDQAAAALRRVAEGLRVSAVVRRRAAVSLAELDPRYRDQAAVALRRVAAGCRIVLPRRRWMRESERRQAIESLAALGPRYLDDAAAMQRHRITSRRTETYDRQLAADWLARQGPRYRDQAADALRDTIADPRAERVDRWLAADWLAKQGPRYRDQAADALREVTASRRARLPERRRAAQALARLDPRYHDEATEAVRRTIASHRASGTDRQQAAEWLAEQGPEYHPEAAAVLRQVLASRRTSRSGQHEAIEALARLDPDYQEYAAAALRVTIARRRTATTDRQRAIEALARLGPRYRDEAAAALVRVLASRRTSSYDRLPAAEFLARLGPQYRDQATAVLRGIADDPGQSSYYQERAMEALARLRIGDDVSRGRPR